ncbi:MAG: DUF2207 domain-containing protein [Thermales bacterium]|nr:DUF2207 domain-containing protein [Thermales bacterium]
MSHIQLFTKQNQLRFRIGQKDIFLQPDTYIYNFTIAADINPNYKVEPILLSDWQDPTEQITLNNDIICQDIAGCEGVIVQKTFNPDQPLLNPFLVFFNYIRAYLLSLIAVSIISYLLWRIFSKDPSSRAAKDSTELEPPQDLLPWQSHFILSEGKVDLQKTLISYLLWLNHQKYITITPKENPTKKDTIDIKIVQDLPQDILPSIFNKAVESMASDGVSKGLKASKINPGQHSGKLHKHIYKSIQDKYSKKPLHEVITIWILISFFLVIGVILILNGLQEPLLIGDSWVIFGVVSSLFFLPYLLWILQKWGNLNRSGIADKDYVKGYHHYLDYVIKEKLDFSNNPN